jgi:hypothetical protein
MAVVAVLAHERADHGGREAASLRTLLRDVQCALHVDDMISLQFERVG